MADVAAEPGGVDVVEFGPLGDPFVGVHDIFNITYGNAARPGVGVFAIEIECRLDFRPGQVLPAELAHPGLVFAAADGRERNVADDFRAEDVPPDEDRPAGATTSNQFRSVSVGQCDGRFFPQCSELRLFAETLEAEAETVDLGARDGLVGDLERLGMQEIVLVGEHEVWCLDAGKRGVARDAAAGVRLSDDGEPCIASGVVGQDRRRVVGRAVVNGKASPIWTSLRQHGVQQRPQESGAVVHGYDQCDMCAHSVLFTA